MDQVQSTLATGVESVFNYGNIAVTVLFLCLIGSAFVNFYMLRFLLREFRRATDAIQILNRKVGHDDENH